MTKQTPPMDWEAAMKSTEANAKTAAKMAERAVAALVETLDQLHHHGQRLSRLEAMFKEMAAKTPAPSPLPHHSLTPPPMPVRPRLPLPLITVVFLLGGAFGGFIANW